MRNNLLFLLFLLCLGGMSCTDSSFLDETQTTDLDRDVIFADSSYTAGFLTQIYANIGFDTEPDRFTTYYHGWPTYYGGLQTASDEAEFKRSSTITTDVMFATGTVNPVMVSDDAWKKCYENIRRVNVFLKYVDGSPINEGTRNIYKAEARFLRAWYYAILLRHYGGIPLIGDNVYNADDEMKASRDSYEDCVDYIVNECEEIVRLNVLSRRRSGRDFGRISEAACRALKARVLLYAASPLHNGIEDKYAPTEEYKKILGYPTYDKERWKKAYDAICEVIAMNEYSLFEWHIQEDPESERGRPEPGFGFYAIFQGPDFAKLVNGNDGNVPGEVFKAGAYTGTILERCAIKSQHRERLFGPPTTGGNGSSGYVYKELADAFPMKDGKVIGESQYDYNSITPNVNRDPRFALSVLYDGALCNNNGTRVPISIFRGTGSTIDAVHAGTPTGFYIYKMLNRNTSGNYFIDVAQGRPLIRYAEILLNYAEAANEYYGPDHTDQYTSIYNTLKAIRKRAGIEAGDDGMYGLEPGMSYLKMQEAIRFERRIELAFEGHRFFDVRRWEIAEETDNKIMHGLEVTRNSDGSKSANEFEVRKHTFRPAMYFWPIPYTETSKSSDLLQNPGYENKAVIPE